MIDVEYLEVLGCIFVTAIIVLAASRFLELFLWRHETANASSAHRLSTQNNGIEHRRHFAVRLPLWLEIPGIASALLSIAIGLDACDAAGYLETTRVIAITPLFVAGIFIMLLPAAGFFDIDVDRRNGGCLTFRRFLICYRRIRISRILLCQVHGDTLYLFVPGRKHPYSIDSYMHGYSQLLGMLVAENVPIAWRPLAASAGE